MPGHADYTKNVITGAAQVSIDQSTKEIVETVKPTQAQFLGPIPSPKRVDSLQRLDLPAGVDIEIKIQQA